MDTKVRDKSNRVITVLSIIALILIMLIIVQYFSKKKTDKLILQNEQLEKEFREARLEINKYKDISEKLDSVIKDANIKIAEKESLIARLFTEKTAFQNENDRLKAEIRDLREDYLEAIDSLLVERGINTSLNVTIEELEDEILSLSKKVGIAELFVIENINAVILKKSPYGHPQKTAMAKKASQIKVCFDIQENLIIQRGLYDIYLRIITPDGKILAEQNENVKTFIHPVFKVKTEYTMPDVINYNNTKTNKCISLRPAYSLKPGLYLVEIFTENQKIGTTTFTLK